VCFLFLGVLLLLDKALLAIGNVSYSWSLKFLSYVRISNILAGQIKGQKLGFLYRCSPHCSVHKNGTWFWVNTCWLIGQSSSPSLGFKFYLEENTNVKITWSLEIFQLLLTCRKMYLFCSEYSHYLPVNNNQFMVRYYINGPTKL
jgi:hypothetical protein